MWYDDQAQVDLVEKGLVLKRWDDRTNAWVDAACGPSTQEAAANWIFVPISTLGEFALFEHPPRVYLPLAMKNG